MATRLEGSVIGATVSVDGEIESEEGLVVQGRVTGKVKSEGALLVDAGAEIEADVEAEAVTVSGRLTGRAEAKQRVEITEDGQMTGDIRAPRILIADGAQYKGNVDMS